MISRRERAPDMLWLEAPATWLGLLATAYNKAVFRAYFRAIRSKRGHRNSAIPIR